MIRERRRTQRLEASLPVEYATAHRRGTCRTLDLGMGGFFLNVLDEELQPGTELELELQLDLGKKLGRVWCQGWVVRVLDRELAASRGLVPGVAVQIREFRTGRTELEEYLRKHLPPFYSPAKQKLPPRRKNATPAKPPAKPWEKEKTAETSPVVKAGSGREDWSREQWVEYFASLREQRIRAVVEEEQPDRGRLVWVAIWALLMGGGFFGLLHLVAWIIPL